MRNNVRPEEAQIYGNVTGYGFKVTPDWASLSMTWILSCAFRCVKEFALGFGPPAESQAITPGANCHGITACQCCRSEVSPLRFANYHASAAIRT